MSKEDIDESEEVTTTSRLQAWWLTKFKGYEVIIVTKSLKPATFGGFRKSNEWVLAPRQETPVKDNGWSH
jgi:hypothetical protein